MEMITSTPMSPKSRNRASSLHRLAVMNNVSIQTPKETPLRRSGPLSVRRSAQSAASLLTTDDDEELERSERRNKNEVIEAVANIPAQNVSANESYKFSGEQEMKSHLQICTKLFMENKINSNNAWDLHIIDLLRHLYKKSENVKTLQVASTSLDIGAKVYGVRVDNLHAGGLKLASSLAKMSADRRESVGDDDDDDPSEDFEKSQTKRKTRRKRMLAAMVAKDPKSLFGSVPKLESVSFSTRINSETNAIDNLFTNVVPMDNIGCRLTYLDNEEKAWAYRIPEIPEKVDVREKFPMKSSSVYKNFEVCAPFDDFIVDKWDVDKEEKRSSVPHKNQNEDEVAFDDNGIPIAVLDGSMHDFEMDDDGHDPMEVDEPQNLCAELHNEVADITQFRPEDATRTEYSYNLVRSTESGLTIYQIWAGPSHWKLKNIRRCTAKYSGAIVDKIVPKCKRKTNFIQPATLDGKLSDLKEFQANKKNMQKKKFTIDTQKTTLPTPDRSLTNNILKHFGELMSKKGIRPQLNKSNKDSTNQGVHDVSVYNYENPNDSQYCPNSADDVGNDGDCMDDNSGAEEIHVAGEEGLIGENLIDAPESVPQTYMYMFSMRAKKMDMKKLKIAAWETLKDESRNCTVEVVSRHAGSTTFSQFYKSLPKYLNSQMKAELSPALAFVSLLHLTNENNLELEQLSRPSRDFTIKGACLK